MTIKKEKMVTLSKKEAEELLFTLKKDDRDEYMKRIAELLQDEKAPEEKNR